MRFPLIPLLVFIPTTVFALNLEPNVDRYDDAARFSQQEAAGISVLTTLGAIQGNPDGNYYANKNLNRAEFVKIVLLSHPAVLITESDAEDCFPDVKKEDWFSRFVCYSKNENIVHGFPTGYFQPQGFVNYAQAAKILVELYGLLYSAEPGDTWFDPYIRTIDSHGIWDEVLSPDHSLTRGEMARLAAAFRANAEGKLMEYKAAEQGEYVSIQQSSSSQSEAAESSASSAASSVASSTQSSSTPKEDLGFHPYSRLLMLGRSTPVLLDGTFTASEDSVVRITQLELIREVRSIDRLELINESGDVIDTLELATSSNELDKKWESIADASGTTLMANTPYRLGIRAILKDRGQAGGAVEELWEVTDFSITVQSIANGTSMQLEPVDQKRPAHQTVQGRITSVERSGEEIVQIAAGKKKLIGEFVVGAEQLTGAIMNLNAVTFTVMSEGVDIDNPIIGDGTEVGSRQCARDKNVPNIINCETLPEMFRSISTDEPRIVSLFADLELNGGSATPFVQVALDKPGSLTENGAVRFSDGTGDYNWVDIDSTPLATGTKFTIEFPN